MDEETSCLGDTAARLALRRIAQELPKLIDAAGLLDSPSVVELLEEAQREAHRLLREVGMADH